MSYTYGGLTLANVGDIVTQTSVSTNFEKLASTSAAPSPGPLAAANPPKGQLWFDSTNSVVKVNTGTPAAPVWTALGGSSVTVATTAPTSPAPKEGDLWYNSDSTVARGFVYYSGTWVDFSPASGSSGSTTGLITGTAAQDYQVAAAAPTTRSVAGASGALVDGDQWYDTTKNIQMTRKSGAWVNAFGTSNTATTNATAFTLTSLFSGSFGNGWYDLAQHGPGLYAFDLYDNGLGMAYTPAYGKFTVQYDGISISSIAFNDVWPNAAKIKGSTNAYHSGPVARYFGSTTVYLSITAVYRVTQ